MPQVSFVKPGTPEAVAADAAKAVTQTVLTPTPVAGVVVESVNTAAPAPAVPQALVTQPVAAANPFGVNDYLPSADEIIWPRINIAQNIGALKDSFIPGSIVLAQETLLYRPPVIKDGSVKEQATPPFRITFLGFRQPRFVEYVPGGGKGMIVKTEAEVRSNGGTLSYDEHKLKAKDGMKKFDILAEALCAIEKPASYADDDTIFVHAADGRKFALALWSFKRMGYTNGAKVIFTKRSGGVLSKGYPTHSFNVTSKWKATSETNGGFIPIFAEPLKNSPEFQAWAEYAKNPGSIESTGAADTGSDE